MSEHEDAEAKRIGRLIAELRLKQGLSQQDLATAIGKHVSTVSRWERGQHEGYAENLRKLAKALKVAPALLRPTDPETETQLDRVEKAIAQLDVKLSAVLLGLEAPGLEAQQQSAEAPLPAAPPRRRRRR